MVEFHSNLRRSWRFYLRKSPDSGIRKTPNLFVKDEGALMKPQVTFGETTKFARAARNWIVRLFVKASPSWLHEQNIKVGADWSGFCKVTKRAKDVILSTISVAAKRELLTLHDAYTKKERGRKKEEKRTILHHYARKPQTTDAFRITSDQMCSDLARAVRLRSRK